MQKPHIVVFTGAGISAESGLRTFRDSGGLWEEYDVYEVATPEAWQRDPELVLRFYNARRKQVREALPNEAHRVLADLETDFEVTVITQNIDDLHERAGSSRVVHLHGEIRKARSVRHPELIYTLEDQDLALGDLCEKGFQLRPHIVWFGEAVPAMEEAAQWVRQADVFAVVGSSLQVYPAAGLIYEAPPTSPKYYIDPLAEHPHGIPDLTLLREKASSGMAKLASMLRDE